jgi:hypothetical protein
MRKLIFILLFPVGLQAQTFFGAVGVPSDPGTSAVSPVAFANPPIASMAAGDLVVVYAYCRNASATIDLNVSGGQNWTLETLHNSSTATLSGRVFWCRFDGTWDAAPSFTFSSTTNTNVVMVVYRPVTSTNSWALSAASTTAHENSLRSFAAAANVGIPQDAGSYTPAQNNNVTVCFVSTDDDNTWTAAGGTTFTKITSPSAQFRNTSGSDASSSVAWLFQTTASSVSAENVFTEATLGNDPGIIGFYIFYEYTPVSLSRRITSITK